MLDKFYRVTTKELLGTFRSASDEYSTRLLKLYHAKTGLPLFLRKDSEKLFRKCLETDPDDNQTRGLKIGILTVLKDVGAPTLLSRVQNIAVVFEEDIVLTDLPDLPTAFALLFVLLYA
ncbi:unnamed protein product [Merluccius merluccius]